MTAARGPEYYALYEHPPPAPIGGNPRPSPVTADSGPTVDTGSLPPVPPPPPQPTPPPSSAASAPDVAPAGQAPACTTPAQGTVSAAPAPVAAASAPGGVPVQPAHDSPTPATPAPLVPALPVPAAATAPPLPTTTSTETAQWSRGQQQAVLALSVLAIILLAGPRFLFPWGGIGITAASLILSTPIVLLIIGIIQIHRRAAPSALVALGALTPVQVLESLHRDAVFMVFDLGAYAAILTVAIICMWGRLPHSRHTPRSAVAVSALAVVLLWRAVVIPAGTTITSRLFLNPSDPFYQNNNYLFFYRYDLRGATAASWVMTFLTLACSIALLVLLKIRGNATLARFLSVTPGACALINIAPIISHSWAPYEPINYLLAPSLLGLTVPVFSRSFRQWCEGTWTPPARTARAVAGRPTILARTFQPVGPDGRPLDHTTVTTLLPTTRLTFWISFFFGLFGLIPMLTANSTAKNLGVVTNAYNHAMIKGLLIGIATWTATTIAFYALILTTLAGL